MTMVYFVETGRRLSLTAFPKDEIRRIYVSQGETEDVWIVAVGLVGGISEPIKLSIRDPSAQRIARQVFIDLVDAHVDLDVTWEVIDGGVWKRKTGRPVLAVDVPFAGSPT